MSKFVVFIFLIFPVPLLATSKCRAPAICSEIQKTFERSRANMNRKDFKELVRLLKVAAKKDCKIQSVNVPVPAYRACYDQGFATATDSKGQLTVMNRFPGVVNEEAVLDWFVFVHESKFPEGKKFIQSKLFQSTIDGAWAERFSQE